MRYIGNLRDHLFRRFVSQNAGHRGIDRDESSLKGGLENSFNSIFKDRSIVLFGLPHLAVQRSALERGRGGAGQNRQGLHLTEREGTRAIEGVDIDNTDQLVRYLHRNGNGGTNLRVWPQRAKARIVDFAVKNQWFALAGHPTGNTFIQRHPLAQQPLAILSPHRSHIKFVIALSGRQEY